MKLAVGAFASLYGYQEKNFMLAFNNPGQYCNGEMVAVRSALTVALALKYDWGTEALGVSEP